MAERTLEAVSVRHLRSCLQWTFGSPFPRRLSGLHIRARPAWLANCARARCTTRTTLRITRSRLECELWTADQRFQRAVDVRWVRASPVHPRRRCSAAGPHASCERPHFQLSFPLNAANSSADRSARASPGARAPRRRVWMRTRSSVVGGLPSDASIRRTWRLRPSASVTLYLMPARSFSRVMRCGGGALAFEEHPLRQGTDVGVRQRHFQADVVLLLVAVAGVHETVGEAAVVGHEDEARRVNVEAADGEEAQVAVSRRDEAGDGRAAAGVVHGREDAPRVCSS